MSAHVLTDRVLLLSYPVPTSPLPSALTAAERSVVSGVLRGWSNREIAAERGCSPRTVANLLARACRKLGATTRTELAARLAGVPEQ